MVANHDPLFAGGPDLAGLEGVLGLEFLVRETLHGRQCTYKLELA